MNNSLMLNYEFKDYHLSVFQNYGSPTRVTRLKVAPNMADPISFNEKRPNADSAREKAVFRFLD